MSRRLVPGEDEKEKNRRAVVIAVIVVVALFCIGTSTGLVGFTLRWLCCSVLFLTGLATGGFGMSLTRTRQRSQGVLLVVLALVLWPITPIIIEVTNFVSSWIRYPEEMERAFQSLFGQ